MNHRIHARITPAAACPPLEQDHAVVGAFLSDAAHVPGGFAAGVLFPRTEDDVAAVMTAGRAVLPVGAQSSLTGGATPRGELVISTRALTSFTVLDDRHVRVGAGLPLVELQRRLAATHLYYPPVPTYDGAFVGGTIATNAAGAATFKYGSTRSWIQALTVVLADGSVLDVARGQVFASAEGTFEILLPGGRSVVVPIPNYRMPDVPKLSAGYYAAPGMDLVDLFVGSEGTLGVVTEATLRVIRRPRIAMVLITCDDDHHAVAITTMLREQAWLAWAGRSPLDVAAIEYMDARSLHVVPDAMFANAALGRPHGESAALLVQIEVGRSEEEALSALHDVLGAAGVTRDPVIALPGDERGAGQLFQLREAVPSNVNAIVARAKALTDSRIDKTAGDLIVPFEKIENGLALYRRVLKSRGLDYAIWGHLSDGNLHVNVLPQTLDDVIEGRSALVEIAREVIALGGSPLAEHGVGRSAMKQHLLRELYGSAGIDQMRAVKRALDPEWRLSPGVLFPPSGEQ